MHLGFPSEVSSLPEFLDFQLWEVWTISVDNKVKVWSLFVSLTHSMEMIIPALK